MSAQKYYSVPRGRKLWQPIVQTNKNEWIKMMQTVPNNWVLLEEKPECREDKVVEVLVVLLDEEYKALNVLPLDIV